MPSPITSPERTLEDHERVLEKLSHWPRVHNNCVLFKNNPEKYYLLKRPQVGGEEGGLRLGLAVRDSPYVIASFPGSTS